MTKGESRIQLDTIFGILGLLTEELDNPALSPCCRAEVMYLLEKISRHYGMTFGRPGC